MDKNIFKSIGVIILAFVVNALLSVLTDFLLESTGVLPNPEKGLFETWAILLVLFYRSVYTILAGFIIAQFAPNSPLFHAIVLGLIGTTITLMAVSNAEFAEKSELWFGYTLATLTIPCLLFGVKIQQAWKKYPSNKNIDKRDLN